MRSVGGFSLVELMVVVGAFAILAGIAVPRFQELAASMRLGQATREVERELQTARLKSVSSNRRLRVRLNCPSAGYYRIVEFLGSAADNSSGRCLEATYPYPATDHNPLTLPNLDGPVRMLNPEVTVTNGAFEFRPDGTAWIIDATGALQQIPLAGATVTLSRKSQTKVINVNPLGKIEIQKQ